MGVDIKCVASVRVHMISFDKHKFQQTQILKNPHKNVFYYCFPFMIIFFTLSTISFVFVFSFISFSIFLQACITVE